jgi:Tfp pilus assembly pilus retraction ATPase PilT
VTVVDLIREDKIVQMDCSIQTGQAHAMQTLDQERNSGFLTSRAVR